MSTARRLAGIRCVTSFFFLQPVHDARSVAGFIQHPVDEQGGGQWVPPRKMRRIERQRQAVGLGR
jgi:hypothetical protein